MCVESEQEWNKEVMRVPKCLERLLADSMVGGSVYEQHTKEHYMPRDTTGFRVVYLYRSLRANLRLLNVEEAITSRRLAASPLDIDIYTWYLLYIMRRGMDDSKEQERVCYLTVKPLRFVQG